MEDRVVARIYVLVAITFAVAGALLPLTSHSAVYRCVGADGQTTYSDIPCSNALRKEGDDWVDVEAENRRTQQEAVEEARQKREAREIVEAERARAIAQAEQYPCGGSESSSACVTRAQFGNRWPYTIPGGVLACSTRFVASYKKQDVTITHAGRTYAINGSARGSGLYAPLEDIWRDNPESPGSKIPEPGLIAKGLSLCR
jgi:hypothetical protein